MDVGVNARTFGLLFGAAYLVVGIVGFFVTGVSEPAAAETDAYLLGLQLNAVHNLVHILIGATLFFAGLAGPVVAKQIVFLLGAVVLVVGIGGFFVLDRPIIGDLGGYGEVNILALNIGDNILHIVSGIAALAVVVVDDTRLAPASAT